MNAPARTAASAVQAADVRRKPGLDLPPALTEELARHYRETDAAAKRLYEIGISGRVEQAPCRTPPVERHPLPPAAAEVQLEGVRGLFAAIGEMGEPRPRTNLEAPLTPVDKRAIVDTWIGRHEG